MPAARICPSSVELSAWVYVRRSHVAYNTRQYARADSLNELVGQLTSEGANYCAMRAALTLQQHNTQECHLWLERCFSQDPNNEVGKVVLSSLQAYEAGQGQQPSSP